MKIRKLFGLFLTTLLAVILFSVSASAAEALAVDVGYMKIAPQNSVFYLPSNADPSAVTLVSDQNVFYIGKDGVEHKVEAGILDLTKAANESKNGLNEYAVQLRVGGTVRHYTFALSGLPTVSIRTTKGLSYLHMSKNNRDKETEIEIYEAGGENGTGKLIYSDDKEGTLSELKGRGNATFSYAKKPYQIKLGKKTDLFGMGKAKTWILLANYIDSSYLRNTVAFTIADAIGMPYTPESTYVTLYVDESYMGIYQLCEKVQIGSNRIEIRDLEEENEALNPNVDLDSLPTVRKSGSGNLQWYTYVSSMNEPENVTGGYLVEMDNLYAGAEKCKFQTKNGNTYVIKSPECAGEKEVKYIAELFAAMEEAIYSPTGYNKEGRHYSEYADIDSLCKAYTLQEAIKNWDAYIGSVFFFKDIDKDGCYSRITAGPAWDYDNSWGNLTNGTFASDKTELWADGDNNYGGAKYVSDFGGHLMQHPEARQLVSHYYAVAAEKIAEMTAKGGLLEAYSKTLHADMKMDQMRFPISGRHQAFKTFAVYTNGVDDTETTAIGYLKSFMTVRTEALKKTLSYELPDNYQTVTAEMEGVTPLCEAYRIGGRGAVLMSDTSIQIVAYDGTGAEVELLDAGEGIYTFTMPSSGITFANEQEEETTMPQTTKDTDPDTETTASTDESGSGMTPIMGHSIWTIVIFGIGVLIAVSFFILAFVMKRKKK